GHVSLRLAEGYSVLADTTRSLPEIVLLPLDKLHLPLYYLILRFWTALFGFSEASLRAPSALFGIASIVAIYLVATRLYDQQVGVLSAALLALSSYHVYYSQEARMYSLFVLLAILSYYWLLRLPEERPRRAAAGYLGTTALLAYTHPFSLFVVLAQNCYVFLALPFGRHETLTVPLRRWIPLQTALGVLIAPWLALALASSTDDSVGQWIEEPVLSDVLGVLVTYLGWGATERELLVGGELLADVRLALLWLVLALALVALSNRALVRSRARRYVPALRRRHDGAAHRALLLVCWVGAPIVVPALLSSVLNPMLVPRYTIPAAAGLFVLLASGIRALRYAHLNVLVALVLVGLLVFPFVGYYAVDHRPQWGPATDYVEANADADDLVLVHEGPHSRYPFFHYFDREDVRAVAVPNFDSHPQLQAAVEGEETIWFVHRPPDRTHVIAELEETHERVERQSYHGVEVTRYEPVDDASA
ncbi:MAG: glycosyltransferase family 39 protein, partial [Halalkalicoccus sp.]